MLSVLSNCLRRERRENIDTKPVHSERSVRPPLAPTALAVGVAGQ